MKALRRGLLVGLAALSLLAVALWLAGRLGGLAGTPPADLGVRGGLLKAPSSTPNSVSSQADRWPNHPQREYARIAPLAMRGDAAATMARLQAAVAAMPGARIVTLRADYLHAEFTTPLLRFVDDAEFWIDPAAGVVHVRSASRLGHGDRGVNRARIEALRERLATLP
jgi:uncharacterized protein (DUF1499 family)